MNDQKNIFSQENEEELPEFVFVPRESEFEEAPRRASAPAPRPAPRSLKKDVARDGYLVLGKEKKKRIKREGGNSLRWIVTTTFILALAGGIAYAVTQVFQAYVG